MSQHVLDFLAATILLALVLTGCHPQQPVFLNERGDLSHYIDRALDIEYPDVEHCSLDEVIHSYEPLTLENSDDFELWDMTLEEAVRITLSNSQVIRSLGGRFASTGPLQQPQTGEAPDILLRSSGNDAAIGSVFDPAIAEAGGPGNFTNGGPEQALSEFDAQVRSTVQWNKNDRPQNFDVDNNVFNQLNQFFARDLEQDTGTFSAEIRKMTASGGSFFFRNNTAYDQNNSPSRALTSDWNVNFEAEFRQPLLQGAGAMYNRIAGPFNPFLGIGDSGMNGVLLARINTDVSLADFEIRIRDLVNEVENAYWELYFGYRNMETQKAGRDASLQAWKKINALKEVGGPGGEAEKEAQARAQYFFFRSNMESALTQLHKAENRLRYLMGLAVSDGRLIRPVDEPTIAKVTFDWCAISAESLTRSPELRRQKWRVKQRELELVATKNHLLPRLDAFGRYRWLGFGDDLISSERSGVSPNDAIPPGQSYGDVLGGGNAFENLTSGDFQEWELGLQLLFTLGFRSELANVRHQQLQYAKSKAVLKEQELELSHQLGDAIRNIVNHYTQTETNFNRRVAAEKEVLAVETAYENGIVTLDLLLDAQRRRADAEIAFFRSLIDYNRAIAQLHLVKGSLLEYNNVYLAEGPWPGKALFDATREARKRDAGHYFDYGYTRPNVISRGPYNQHQGHGAVDSEIYDASPSEDYEEVAPTLESLESLPEPRQIESEDETTASKSILKLSSGPRLFSPRAGSKSPETLTRQPSLPIRSIRSAQAQNSRVKTPAKRRDQAAPQAIRTTRGNVGSQSSVRKLSYGESVNDNNDSSHERIENQPTPATAAAASGWKGTQHQFTGPSLRR